MEAVTDTDVIIAGAGPVGLYAGCLLAEKRVRLRHFERRSDVSKHTRSIGIHPPSLEMFERSGLAETLVERGHPIRSGSAYFDGTLLGSLSLDKLPGAFPFILSIPQPQTEQILLNHYQSLVPNPVTRGDGVAQARDYGDHVRVTTESGINLSCRVLLGCDGKTSTVRSQTPANFHGHDYPDRYAMGDFRDDSDFGDQAVLFLGRHGLVESFPLPGQIRRWVVRTDSIQSVESPDQLVEIVKERTAYRPDPLTHTMFSAFGVSAYIARPSATGRVFLAGDAAHVVSPIGGQGMNLGWLDVRRAVPLIEKVLSADLSPSIAARAYSVSRKRAYRVVKRRSEFNMWMGRPSSFLQKTIARTALSRWFSGAFLSRFTMRRIPE